jgi:hypothetical protein
VLLSKTRFPVLIEHLRAGLHEQVRAFLGPLHLLPLHHSLGQQLIYRRLDEAGGDALAVALSLGVIDNKAAVLLHVGVKISK